MRIIFVFIIFFFQGMYVFSQHILIEGIVKDNKSNKRVPSKILIEKVLSPENFIKYDESETDSLGYFQIKLPKNKYRIQFEAPYYNWYVVFIDSTKSGYTISIPMEFNEEPFKLFFQFNSYNINDLDSTMLLNVLDEIKLDIELFKRVKYDIIIKADVSENSPRELSKVRGKEVVKYFTERGIAKRHLKVHPRVLEGRDFYEIKSNRTFFFCKRTWNIRKNLNY